MTTGKVRGRAERTGKLSQVVEAEVPLTDQGLTQDEAEILVGDGLAKVTVSADRAEKYMGRGSSVFCSVTLTCNQDLDSIREARDLALAMATGYLPEMLAMAEELWAAESKDD